MKMQRLQLEQINDKLMAFKGPSKIEMPSNGWINSIRTSLGISQQQLGKKLMITKQSVSEIEQREKEGSITIKALKEVAKAMDLQLVYGFVPKDGSLDSLIERKAMEVATQIVMRTSHTMKLEDQENSKERIEKAIRERAVEIKNDLSKILWD